MTATVSTRAKLAAYRVHNVSAGGALLTDGPLIAVGDTVETVIRLRSHVVARLAATVVRHDPLGACGVGVAVAFSHDTDETEDALQDAALRELERRARPAVLVVSQRPETLAISIEHLDVPVLVAQTPLDALATLVDAGTAVGAVVVDAALGGATGIELLRVVAEIAPDVRRVFASPSATPLEHELARARGAAHATVRISASSDRLRAALLLP